MAYGSRPYVGMASPKNVGYLNMFDPSQQCPSVWQKITTPFQVCGRRSTTGSCEGLNYTTSSEQYDQVCWRIVGYIPARLPRFIRWCTCVNWQLLSGRSLCDGLPAYTSGVLLLVFMSDQTLPKHIYACPCVAGSTIIKTLFLHLWVTTISVRQA